MLSCSPIISLWGPYSESGANDLGNQLCLQKIHQPPHSMWIFHVALNTLPWVQFDFLSQGHSVHCVCSAPRFCFRLFYSSCHTFTWNISTPCMVFLPCFLISTVRKSTKSNQSFGLLMTLLALGEKMSLQALFMAIQSLSILILASRLPSFQRLYRQQMLFPYSALIKRCNLTGPSYHRMEQKVS